MSKPEPWSQDRLNAWYAEHPVLPHRDYKQTLEPRITALASRRGFNVEKYGEATYSTRDAATGLTENVTHNLYCVIIGDFDYRKPTYLIMGGTHGYEKGGPEAALGFAEEEAIQYAGHCNFIVYPCLCPGPYEKELRFTEGRIDPNRDALPDGAKSQEMRALAASLKDLHMRMYGGNLRHKFAAAIDLHETPKKDLEINEENAAVGGELFVLEDFPEGMFVIAFDKDHHAAEFIIASVRADGHEIVRDEKIYGVPNHRGILLMSEMGKPVGRVRQLTSIYTDANFTTEFCGLGISDDMPDADRAAPQRSAIRGMLPK